MSASAPADELEALAARFDAEAATLGPWFGNGHLQTIAPALLRRPRPLRLRREIWEAPDDDVVDVSLLPERPGAPGVLVLHGLEGSAESPYVRGLLARVDALGWNGLALELRSCGPTPSRRGAIYHSGATDELAFVAGAARARWAGAPIAVVGFSLGGNIVLKWMGEAGASAAADVAVAISTPYDLGASAAHIDRPGALPLLYRERFLRSLRRKAGALARQGRLALAPEAVAGLRTFAAYDDAVTAPLWGFAGALDYWARCSSARALGGVRRPTLAISADDDPFVPLGSLPLEALGDNPALTFLRAPRGGHVGFFAGPPWRPRYFAEAAAVAYLRAHLA